MNKLIVLFLTLVLAGISPVSADDTSPAPASKDDEKKQVERKVPWGKATRHGLFREKSKGMVRADSNSATGKSIKRPVLEFSEEDTQRVPLRKGVYFGYRYWLRLPPDQARPELKRVLIHPEMSLPDGSRVTRSERKIRKKSIEGIVTSIDAYALSEDYELVEGDWVFQLWYEDEMLVETTFTTYKPAAGTNAAEEKNSEKAPPPAVNGKGSGT